MSIIDALFFARKTQQPSAGAEAYATRSIFRRPVVDMLAHPAFMVRSPIAAVEGAMLVQSPINVINGLGGIQSGAIRHLPLMYNPNSNNTVL